MPTYEYACSSCGNAWEETQRITEPALEVCPACKKATAKRQISGGSFILKGGGWYSDLYSSSKGSNAKKDDAPKTGDGAGEAKSESKSDAKAETKTETKSETKAAPGAGSSSAAGATGGTKGPSKSAAE